MNLSDEAKAARAAYQKAWRIKNPDYTQTHNEYQREWRRNNPEKVAQYNSQYWERKANSESRETKVIKLRKQGYSLRDIGTLLDIPKTTVSRILEHGTDNGTDL